MYPSGLVCLGAWIHRLVMVSRNTRGSQTGRRRTSPWAIAGAIALGSFGCARVTLPPSPPVPTAVWLEEGIASWYGDAFHGRETASGEIYDMEAMTAAHRTLPFGTVLQVQNLDNGRVTTVRVNDRGPFVSGRHVDLSRRAALELDMVGSGTARVRLAIVDAGPQNSCWTVQAGAFGDRDTADQIRASLEREGHSVRITTAPNGLHRVRAGPFQSRIEAEELTRSLGGTLLGC